MPNPRKPERIEAMERAKREYLDGYDDDQQVGRIYPSLSSLALKFDVPIRLLEAECSKQGWARQREQKRVVNLTRIRERRQYQVAKLEAVFNDKILNIANVEMAVLNRIAQEHGRMAQAVLDQERTFADGVLVRLDPVVLKEMDMVSRIMKQFSGIKADLFGVPVNVLSQPTEYEEVMSDEDYENQEAAQLDLVEIYKLRVQMAIEQSHLPAYVGDDDDQS